MSSPFKKLIEAGLNIRAVNLNDMGCALLLSALRSRENLWDGSESQRWACEGRGEGRGVGEVEDTCSWKAKVASLRDDSLLSSRLFGDGDAPGCP